MPDQEQTKIINEQLGGTEGAKDTLNKPFMENTNKEEVQKRVNYLKGWGLLPDSKEEDNSWEREFDAKFGYFSFPDNGNPEVKYHWASADVKIFIRNLLQKSSLKGERNRLMYEMKQEARKELLEELEGKLNQIPAHLVETRKTPGFATAIEWSDISAVLSSYKDHE